MDHIGASRLAQLAKRAAPGYTLQRAWPLKGGVSAQVTALELLTPDRTSMKLVVRRHGQRDLQRHPQLAADEFRLLQVLHTAKIPVPRPHYLDQSCDLLPTPYLVVEYIEGKTELTPENPADCVRQMAAQLARIHALDTSSLAFLPRLTDSVARWLSKPMNVDWSAEDERQLGILRAGWDGSLQNSPALLHGDFWPGNVLWNDGQVAGIIDWEDACLGDPIGELALARLEIMWAMGTHAMSSFTDRYRSLTNLDYSALPWWDLWVTMRTRRKISDWGLDKTTEERMRGDLKLFAARALEQL